MKEKNFTQLFVTAIMLLGMTMAANSQDLYHGNSNWDELSDYHPIVIENFQDWNYDDGQGYGLKVEPSTESCATNARSDVDLYSTFTVLRPIDASQGVTGNFAFYLDFCLIYPNCDTQSGTLYTENPDGVGSGDNQGESWPNVSMGSLNIYDNYQGVRPETMGVGGDGSGSVTTSKISKLERVQYTTSAYGKKRGFNLEIGYDMGDGTIFWGDTLRYIPGATLSTMIPREEFSSVDQPAFFEASNRGWVFEEKFDPETYQNVYLRWRPTNPSQNRQIVRLHDIKIYGEINQDDVVTAVSDVTTANELKITRVNKTFHVSQPAKVDVYNIAGVLMFQSERTSNVNMSNFKSGIYIFKAQSEKGNILTQKIVL